MKKIIKYLGALAMAGALGLQTMNVDAAGTCEAGQTARTSYFLFLAENSKSYYDGKLESSEEYNMRTKAMKENITKDFHIIEHGNVAITANGKSTYSGSPKTWTAGQFWKNYYDAAKTISARNDGSYVYTTEDGTTYILHGEWWEIDAAGDQIGNRRNTIIDGDSDLMIYIQANYDNLDSSPLVTKGTSVPSSPISPPGGFETSQDSRIAWTSQRHFTSDGIPEGITVGASVEGSPKTVYSPAAYYITYCVQPSNDNPNPSNPNPGNPGTTNPQPTNPNPGQNDKFKIYYHLRNGSNGPEDREATVGTQVTISDKIPTQSGHEFLGWTDKEDEVQPNANYKPGVGTYAGPNDLHLYACWKSKTGISAHFITFGLIALVAGGALLVAKKKNLFRQI